MPSSYTTNLGIELPNDGELDGVWGDVVNTNMDILDRAINGGITLTLSGASSTLTTTDGTLSDGQNKLLILGGTPSGTHTITVSPNDAEKLYYVYNLSGQSVVFSQGSGTTVTVATGDTAVIYCDGAGSGAGVINVVDHFAMNSVRITGGTITGITDLAIADGGTGASTASQALLNFGITATAAELNILDGVTASTAELNILDGATLTTAELNYVDGVTSAIQTQLDAKQASDATLTALAGYNTNGILTQTAPDTFTGRTLTAGTGVTVTNGDGVSGNPTVAVTTASTSEIQGLSGTNKVPTTAGIATAAALATPSGGADWTPDWAAFISATWVLTGNRALANPTNVIAGTTRVVRVSSDSASSRTITYGANYKGFSLPASVTNTAVVLLTLYAVSSSEIVVSAVEYTA